MEKEVSSWYFVEEEEESLGVSVSLAVSWVSSEVAGLGFGLLHWQEDNASELMLVYRIGLGRLVQTSFLLMSLTLRGGGG